MFAADDFAAIGARLREIQADPTPDLSLVREQRWRYQKRDGKPIWLPFDPAFPCIFCERPVTELSCAGPAICGSCDCGHNADGTKWSNNDFSQFARNANRRIDDLPDDPVWAAYEADYRTKEGLRP